MLPFFSEIGWPEKDTGTMEEPRFRRWQGWDEDKRPGGMMEGEVDVLKLVGYKALRDRQSRVFDFQCREAKLMWEDWRWLISGDMEIALPPTRADD